MTDELRERVARAICEADGQSVNAVFNRIAGYEGIENEYFDRADAALNALHPGDVLPNGWVAPDEPSEEMSRQFIKGYEVSTTKSAWENAYAAMRAAAIREREG